jgi:hypothetical protein
MSNSPPTASHHTFNGFRPVFPHTFNPNAIDPDGDRVVIRGVSTPSKGTVVYNNSDGEQPTFTYTPFENAIGTDFFIFRVSDGLEFVDRDVTIHHVDENSNAQPQAADDGFSIPNLGRPSHFHIGSNDTDQVYYDNDPSKDRELTTSGLTAPSKGTVVYDSRPGADFAIYTPFVNAIGNDSFTYQVTDAGGLTDTATVTVTITGTSLPGETINFSRNFIGDGPNTISNFLFGSIGDDSFIGDPDNNDDIIDYSQFQILDNSPLTFSSTDFSIRENGKNIIVSNPILGTDTFSDVEMFKFNDGTFQLSELLNLTDIDRGIYRFFNVDTGTHFFSADPVERDSIINNLDSFNFEGATFRAADPTHPAADTVFRFFNTQTGTHFFTQSTGERDNILDTLPQYNFEGEAYKGYTGQIDGSIPLYRFLNRDTGTHFYTVDEAEKNSILESLPAFSLEFIAYYVDPLMG